MLWLLLLAAFLCFFWDAVRACLRRNGEATCLQLTPLGLAFWALYHLIPLLMRLS